VDGKRGHVTQSVAAADTARVVILDRAHLLAEWRDLLAFLLQPEHHCCVILIDTAEAGHHLREEFLQDGGHACLQAPLQKPEVISTVQEAAARRHAIEPAYAH
jgi:FixJ family two-component response regulator